MNNKKLGKFCCIFVLCFVLALSVIYALHLPSQIKGLIIPLVMIVSFTIFGIVMRADQRKRKPTQYDIQHELSVIDQLSGQNFEYWCAKLLKDLGFGMVFVTQSTRDYGADIWCYINDEKVVVQCKRYNKHVGIQPIQEILGARIHYSAKKMIVMTNNYFTDDAKNLASKAGVNLWDRNELIRRMKDINKQCQKNENEGKKRKTGKSIATHNENTSCLTSNNTLVQSVVKHDYKITVMRYYDNTTYDLHRFAIDSNEAVSSVNRVIDINETVIKVEDCGAYVLK